MELTVRHHEGLSDIPAPDWNRLNTENNPFLRHEFLHGLETTNCLEPEGWYPRHITVENKDHLVAALPLYLRTNSYGEFVFDWAWADAYERAGGTYYPKLVSAIPFTPVRGQRLLLCPSFGQSEELKKILTRHLLETAEAANISSFHCLFPNQNDADAFSAESLLLRKGFQFHWRNNNYENFTEFLDSLSSKKRKQIKRERKLALKSGVKIEVLHGSEISSAMWETFYQFYCSTFYQRWGNPRLTLDFFKLLSQKMPESTLLIMARQEDKYIAGAYAMLDSNTLYGRHWGCNTHIPYLHFELCYYQTIEYCIQNKLQSVDAGVQGEHKLSRGFDPVPTYSCHWIKHQGFRESIRDFLEHESREIDAYVKNMNAHLPYKALRPEYDHPH